MTRGYRWSELKVGIVSGAAVIAIAAGILFFARVGALHGATSRLVVLTDNAAGVLPGTEVWLAGEKVGLVNKVVFLPVSNDTSRRIGIEAEILSQFLPHIRKNSRADIRPGGNLIGSPVLYITPGTLAYPAAKSGDTIATRAGGVMTNVDANAAQLVARLTVLADSGSKAIALLNSEAGAAGAFTRLGLPRIANVAGTMSSLMREGSNGNGSAGMLARGDLGARFRSLIASKDSLTQMMTTGNGNIGRFRRDSTLVLTIARLRAEADSLTGMMGNEKGTVARLRSDTSLASGLARVRAQLDSLMTDVKKHPRKYL